MDLDKISQEINSLSLKTEQLQERRDMLKVLQDFRNRSNINSTAEASNEQTEIQHVEKELQELFMKKSELMKTQDQLSHHIRQKDDYITSQGGVLVLPHLPDVSLVYVEAPPPIPAPEVILDIQKLPATSSQTQCPECRQFITTEIVTSISDLACLVCFTMSLCGCVLGCCLIPFCIDNLKDVTHRCPRCRSSIITIKKL
ncbi:hypothetical protein DPEC_G00279110 [Dallia pectoralis]|uniref:Uncharacterized protein n=1 Tax=Dallia pectoralis TaxID=75939 RepID=A0ACC2FM62_DALPE|nr:hypothetical protein DPEC_G00279110 [Dallia pectoralis]